MRVHLKVALIVGSSLSLFAFSSVSRCDDVIANDKKMTDWPNDFSRDRIANVIYPGHGSSSEHAQCGELLAF